MAGPLLTSEGKLKDTVDPAAADAHKGHTPDDRVAVAFLRRYTTRMGRGPASESSREDSWWHGESFDSRGERDNAGHLGIFAGSGVVGSGQRCYGQRVRYWGA